MNDATRRVRLWMLDEQAYYDSIREELAGLVRGHDYTGQSPSEATADLVEELGSYISDMVYDETTNLTGLISDLVTSSLQEVDWKEIADDFVDDFDDEIEENVRDANSEDEEDSE